MALGAFSVAMITLLTCTSRKLSEKYSHFSHLTSYVSLAFEPLHPGDSRHFHDIVHDLVEVVEIGDFNLEGVDPALVHGALDGRLGDVRLAIGDGLVNVGENPFLVVTKNPDTDRQGGLFSDIPGDLD